MSRLAVETGVGQQGVDFRAAGRLPGGRFELGIIRPRPAARHDRQDDMARAVADDRCTRVAGVSRGLELGVLAPLATFYVVSADVMRLETRTVDRSQFHTPRHFALFRCPLDGHIQQSLDAARLQQATGGFLKCREVGNRAQLDRRGQCRRVLQNSL